MLLTHYGLRERWRMANLTNKRSFVHRAYRNLLPDSEPDLMLKWKLIKVLRSKFGVVARTGPKIAIHRKYGFVKTRLRKDEISDFHLHNPDVTALKEPTPLIFEIDGDVHFFNHRGVRRTNERNEHYDQALINGKKPRLIWLTNDEMKLPDERVALLIHEKLTQQGVKHKIQFN